MKKGVAVLLEHGGRLFGIPLLEEDDNKFEIYSMDGEVISYSYLGEKEIGAIGGAVNSNGGETAHEALQRELGEELLEVDASLANLVSMLSTKIPHVVLSELPGIVSQLLRDPVTHRHQPRAEFTVEVGILRISADEFEQLKHLLREINTDSIDLARPFAVAMIKHLNEINALE